MTAVIAAEGVVKRYGATVALDSVDLELASGRVHAIVGENGAGKSTLGRVFAGVVHPDAGRVLLDGAAVPLTSRRAAIVAGVGLVPQALSLIGELSLVDNHVLSTGRWRFDRDAARVQLARAARVTNITVPLDRRTALLSLAERQLGEVLLALAAGARILILDEPTSSLGPLEVEQLIRRLRELAAAGTAIALITHRLDEVLRVADDVTVLRRGRVMHQGPASVLNADQLAMLMVGEMPSVVRPPRRTVGAMRLRASGISLVPVSGPTLSGLDLVAHAGEIVGIAGVAGSGQRALVDVLAGLVAPLAGSVEVDGVDVTGRADRASAAGVAWIPEERGEGVVEQRSIADNAILRRAAERAFSRFGVRRRRRADAFGLRLCECYDVRPPRPALPAKALSGGNQQKLMVGRELETGPSVVVAHGPTQGLDLRAEAAMQGELVAAATAGAAVVVVSADLDEILGLADRIIVMNAGRLVDELDGYAPDVERLGRGMAGLI